jgi:hypothetical protein
MVLKTRVCTHHRDWNFTATLKLHGKAPVRLIWYKGEGHGNRLNVHRLDYIVRTMEWFDYYLKSDRPKDRTAGEIS